MYFRPLVIEKICELMSLVPRLKVKTPEYEVSMVNRCFCNLKYYSASSLQWKLKVALDVLYTSYPTRQVETLCVILSVLFSSLWLFILSSLAVFCCASVFIRQFQ